MENLLGRTAIAEDMDAAIAIAGRHGHRFRIVTLDGQVLNAGGSMTGGSTSRSSGVLTRANELNRLEQRRAQVEQQLKAAGEQLQEAAKAAAQAEAEIAGAQNQLREAEDQVLRLQQQKQHFAVLLDTLRETISGSRQEMEIVEGLLTGGNDQEQTLNRQVTECQNQKAELEAQLARAQAELDEAMAHAETLSEAITQTQLKISALAAEQNTAIDSKNQLEALAQAVSGDREKRRQLMAQYGAENEALAGEIQEKNQQAEQLQAQIGTQRQLLQEAGEKRLKIEGKKTQTEKDAQKKNKDLMDMERECARLEQKKATTAMEEKQILDKLWDNYELTNTTAQEAKVEIESLSAAQKRIGELRRKMNALGHPNIGAIEEFQRVNERYEYLSGQRDDVENSQKELQKIVGDITGEMTEIFAVEFKKINEYFGQTFTEMFGGGKASLQLEDENDILSCGIEIKVQPPGKQVKTIMLLSGGEKAFVAIALYFAIMKVRPTPFCMLDEIDAALDDRNVGRFAAYLRNLSSKTQFIVITHRRGTMEAADVLYGVTMQEQGVSKVLSVDLNQVVKELNIT